MTQYSVIFRISIIIFCVEALIMVAFRFVDVQTHEFLEAFLDALLLTIFSAPLIYLWITKPFISAREKAEAEQLKTHERAQKIIDYANEAIITINQQQEIVSFNQAAELIFGYAQKDILGRSLNLLLPKGSETRHEHLVHTFGTRNQTGQKMGTRREIRGRRKNGEEFFAEGSITKHKTQNGLEFTVILQDISEHKQAEIALLESESRFRDFATSSVDWFWELGPDLRFTYLSDRFRDIVGLPMKAILGKTRAEITALDVNDPDTVKHLADLERHLPFKDFRYKTLRHDGTEIYFSDNGVPMFDDDGVFQGYRGTSTDVTEAVRTMDVLSCEVQSRREAEAFLRQELEGNRLLAAVIDASSIGVTISDTTREHCPIVYCNKAYAEITGYAVDEIKGKDLFFVFGADTDPEAWQMLDQVIEQKQRVSLEMLCYKKDGTTFWNSLTLFSIYDDNQVPTNIVSIQVDITERMELRQEKEQMLLHALETSKIESLGTLAGGIAHEINTPIQYIGDNIMFLQKEAVNFFALLDCYENLYTKAKAVEDLADDVNQVDQRQQNMDMDFLRTEVPLAISQSLDGVEKVANIVKAVKEFSHPGSQEMQSISINHLIDNVTTITHNQWKYYAVLEKNLAGNLPSVECNPNELNQVFVNLIVNASQAIEEQGRADPGTISIFTRQVDDSIEVTIGDDGPGIPEADQDQVFDMFFTTKPPGKGTGQGLAICQNIIKNHNGTITVDTAPGQGTTFTIVLPLMQPPSRT